MGKLLAAVISDPGKTNDVLNVWMERGLLGVTCLESKGLAYFVQAQAIRDDVPLFPSLRNLLPQPQEPYSTFLAVVPESIALQPSILVLLHRCRTRVLLVRCGFG